MEASLRFLGFPRQIEGSPASDLSYDYGQVSATGPFTRHSGYYTAYGDVRTIVNAADDRFAILGSGDEVALEFDASALPAAAARMDAGLLFLCRWFCEGHGLL